MTLFRVDASIRRDGSVSREVADTWQRAWTEHHPHDAVLHRDLGASPLPPGAWPLAVGAGLVPEDERTPEQRAAVTLASNLGDELLAADAVLIATPLYNYGIAQHLKTWIDLLITDPRFMAQPLAGKPVTLVIARGGGYAPGTPREGWDHATPYLRQMFGDFFGADLTVVVAELTLADSVPAMADLREAGAASKAEALRLAETTGRAHAQLVAAKRADGALEGVA
ncbi:FMN-dependent NADH-azoreductase [Pseudonocardia xinjiangensis]|uniref:FMN dependent NADH:quinone oxidoreductase n=1 Tax=Pseudonocardia xinjiangensis TaxID=75289 RepID=A0ABX1RKA1_9PSEU|nr:NAD(P)H-dependent oxidoreductase [Pseudonocardia xinjiangensis]NMH80379.1 flavodoxin family protein [Pseudonocardia xinjiangensis]